MKKMNNIRKEVPINPDIPELKCGPRISHLYAHNNIAIFVIIIITLITINALIVVLNPLLAQAGNC